MKDREPGVLQSMGSQRVGYGLVTEHNKSELLIAKLRLKLEKVGKTMRPSRFDLNQIPYDYTVEVVNSRD